MNTSLLWLQSHLWPSLAPQASVCWQWVLGVSHRARGESSVPMGEITLYSILIVAGIFILVFIAMKTRHWLLDNSEDADSGEFFSISQLRDLRDQGMLTEEEYESAKRVLVAQGLSMLSNNRSAR